jgi:SAM-dependent methyltransferase
MQIEELRRHWDSFGKKDPLWAILTVPGKRGGQWDVGEFFNMGVVEIQGVTKYLDDKVPGYRTGLALDFGCGVGRLTQALCAHFDRCIGVDIAESMVDLANRFNLYGDRCEYRVNTEPHLRLFEDHTFDFIYSNIVLQHMEPQYSSTYMREFVRLLSPAGYALFQVPAQPATSAEGTGAAVRLPDSGFRAMLSSETISVTTRVGASFDLVVYVRNESNSPWRRGHAGDGRYLIQLGNHWLDTAQRVLRVDDGRTPLDSDVAPGEVARLTLTAEAPQKPGMYILELDMVQEHVAWFGQCGSDTLGIMVEVVSDSPTAGPSSTEANVRQDLVPTSDGPAETDAPRMEMYCVPREDVVRLVQEAGGSVVDVQPSSAAGPAYLSYRYLISGGGRQ